MHACMHAYLHHQGFSSTFQMPTSISLADFENDCPKHHIVQASTSATAFIAKATGEM